MPLGPGKYDEHATKVRNETDAAGVILIVIDGKRGSGFSVQASPDFVARLPTLLRAVADGIDEDLKS